MKRELDTALIIVVCGALGIISAMILSTMHTNGLLIDAFTVGSITIGNIMMGAFMLWLIVGIVLGALRQR